MRLSWLQQQLLVTLCMHNHWGQHVVHGLVYFERDDGTTCINGICYGIDPSIYKEIPMFNDCVDLRANCPERVHECFPPNHHEASVSLVSTTKTSTRLPLISSSSSSSSWRYVQAHCPKTCGVCHERIRSVPMDEAWEPPPIGYPDNHVVLDGAAGAMGDDDVDVNLGVVQILDADGTHDHVHVILELLDKTRDYVRNVVLVQDRYQLVRQQCVNHHNYCAYWAAVTNQCRENAPYMLEHCPAVCFKCHELHEDAKCPKHQPSSSMSSNIANAWSRPGDLHRMFQTLVSDPDCAAQYSPTILSRPHGSSSTSGTNPRSSRGGPWIVQLDDFLFDDEVDRFLELHGAARGKKGGRTTSSSSSSSSSRSRSSSNSHGRIQVTHPRSRVRNCTGACAQDEVVLSVLNRLERLTGIPVNNTEPLQFYRSSNFEQQLEEMGRHDFLEHQVERMEGPRILSIILFLNEHEQQDDHLSLDTTDEHDNSSNINTTDGAAAAGTAAATTTTTSMDRGGQVVFPRLNNLTIAPQRGRALIWPNVLNENPNLPDLRTVHYTTPVILGDDESSSSSSSVADLLLFRVNVFLHLRDFAIPKEMGCA